MAESAYYLKLEEEAYDIKLENEESPEDPANVQHNKDLHANQVMGQ